MQTPLKTNEVVVLATTKAKPGKEADLERALRDVAAPTRAQRGCLKFELYRSVNDPAAITDFERWSSVEDHERHLQGDQVKMLMTRFDGILTAPPEIVALRPLDAFLDFIQCLGITSLP
jgi:quinol monooxygenase YgiN